jgi:hypothetical protein
MLAYLIYQSHRMILPWTGGTAWWVWSTVAVLLDKQLNILHLQREDVYKHFRFTSRASWLSLTGLVLVPGAILYLSARQDVRFLSVTVRIETNNFMQLKWKWTGKQRGESLLSHPSQRANATEE